MLKSYLKNVYQRTMNESYSVASKEIIAALRNGGDCLDCGAGRGHLYRKLSAEIDLEKNRYYGIEWNEASVAAAKESGLNILQGDLNKKLPFTDDQFSCVFALSVLEHLLNGCHFINECHRILKRDGKLVLLTPNISTYFTALLLLLGKMPSSGPHPDSSALLQNEELFKVSSNNLAPDPESDTPVHRHLVIFSFSVLEKYLKMAGFTKVSGYGFGLYPFPNFLQPALEKIDPYHCHQMVFIAEK